MAKLNQQYYLPLLRMAIFLLAILLQFSMSMSLCIAENLKKPEEQYKEEQTRHKAIIPVDRNSKEYRDALDSYKKAVKNEEQAITKAQQQDSTWARAKYLLETKGIGSVSSTSPQEKKFMQECDKTKIDKYNQWKMIFTITTTIDTIEQEWKKESASHPAILFITNIALERKRLKNEVKTFNSSDIDKKEMLKGDEKTVEQYFVLLKQNKNISVTQMESLERDIDVPSVLKNTLKTNIVDSVFFLFYETYFREFTPDYVKNAKQEVSNTINKLNNLRPNWAYEEKIEFPKRQQK
ncbi:MAG: hypothetical protein LBK06_01255 [Planctomycetaceae bacterium]|jgi:hypothetical protein|nr:hypothetical protein [Planctomycetaceae bacterium]